jgi:hypothetical protein
MSGASAHKSRTQRQARRLAADLAKGRMPASTVDLEDYLDRFPDDVFVALDGFVEQVASSGADDAIARLCGKRQSYTCSMASQRWENVLPLAVPPDFTDATADMVTECEGDPFQLAGALAEAGHAIPAEARILMAIEQIRSTNAQTASRQPAIRRRP